MNVAVTCGPGYEPIDQVRRITNFSTGRLGISLANALTDHGWNVFCLKGEGATCSDPLRARRLQVFSTNQDLAVKLEALAGSEKIDAVLHAAALGDFRVERVLDEAGREIKSSKFASRGGRVRLELAPTLKVLRRLREWFPFAWVAGWKYELEGNRAEALKKAFAQVQECRTDACVLNGAAYGEGFAVCRPGGGVQECADAAALAATLIELLGNRVDGARREPRPT